MYVSVSGCVGVGEGVRKGDKVGVGPFRGCLIGWLFRVKRGEIL